MTSRQLIGMIVAVFGLLGPAAVSAGEADFTLVNSTGYDLREVYISPTNRNNWGSDRLGDGTLGNSRSKLFTFSDNANCMQDLKVVFDDDGSSSIWKGLDLCEINKLTIRYNRSTDTVTAIKE